MTGAGPQTSECINSRGFKAWKLEIGKENWCILPLKQCLQWEKLLLLFEIQTLSTEEKATSRTLSLGCPNLWCHSNHLFCLFTWKLDGKRATAEGWFFCGDDSKLKWEDDLMKFLE